MSLGTELNNPFDLRDEGIPWKGLIGAKDRFCEFDTIEHGLRAGFRDIHTAWKMDGLNSIRQIVSKYAPPSENDSTAYINAVCKETNLGPDDPLQLDVPENLCALGMAVLRQEQGKVDPSYNLTQAVYDALA